jgi:glycosyltransferase involved in cell wall biosynthesis
VGPREFVVDGDSGLLVPQRDDRALDAAMRRLETDRELQRRLRARGLALVEERFDLERVARQWLAALDGSAYAAPAA